MHPRRYLWAPPLVLLFALAVRVAYAAHKGLVLDEFHSYFHATREGLDSFFQTLRLDNHPPLSFLLIGGSARILGEGELALRLPAILASLLELALVVRLARPLGRGRASLALALVGFSTLHLDMGTQARMYALLSLSVTGLTLALIEHLEGLGGRRRWMVLWALVGFHSHYYTIHYSVVLGLGIGGLALARPDLRPRIRALVPPGLAALALSLPWALWGLRVQLQSGLPPGGDDLGLTALVEGLGHLFYLNAGFAGRARGAMLAGALCVLALALLGVLRGARRDPLRTYLLALTAFGLPVAAMLGALAWGRAGFTWHYILPSCAPMAVLAAGGVTPGAGGGITRAAAAYAVVTLLWLSGLHLASRGSEDFPGAVGRILELAQEGDAIVSVEFQPPFFPQGQPWDYYAPRESPAPPPRLVMVEHEFDVADPAELREARRVILLVSKLPATVGVRRRLEASRRLVLEENFGFGRWVMVYE